MEKLYGIGKIIYPRRIEKKNESIKAWKLLYFSLYFRNDRNAKRSDAFT